MSPQRLLEIFLVKTAIRMTNKGAEEGHLNSEKAKSFKDSEQEMEQCNEESLIKAYFANLALSPASFQR